MKINKENFLELVAYFNAINRTPLAEIDLVSLGVDPTQVLRIKRIWEYTGLVNSDLIERILEEIILRDGHVDWTLFLSGNRF